MVRAHVMCRRTWVAFSASAARRVRKGAAERVTSSLRPQERASVKPAGWKGLGNLPSAFVVKERTTDLRGGGASFVSFADTSGGC